MQTTIIEELHDESGHKGREGTYRRIADRYWWDNMFQQVKKYVQTCVPCQHRDPTRPEEELHPTWTSELFARVAVDVVYMPSDAGYSHLVVGRCDLSAWVEVRSLRGATSEHVNHFSNNLLPGTFFKTQQKLAAVSYATTTSSPITP